MPVNNQAPTPRAISDGSELLMHSVFPTIQGEGPYAGWPAVFVRLAGCNLQCPLCDTEYTEGAYTALVDDVAADVADNAANRIRLVVITGGEPFRQNIAPLIDKLMFLGYLVQVETNGKLTPQDLQAIQRQRYIGLSLVVSPKTSTIAPFFQEHASCFKYVVQAGEVDSEGYPVRALQHPTGPAGVAKPPDYFDGVVYFQPADESLTSIPRRNYRNIKQAVECVEMGDNRGPARVLCLQLHKIIGVD